MHCIRCGRIIDVDKTLCHDCQHVLAGMFPLARPVRYKKPLVGAILSFFACVLGWISFEASDPLIFYIVLPIWNVTLGGSIPSLIFGIQAIRRFYRDEKQFGKGSTTALVLGKCATIFSSMAIFWAGLAVAKFFGVV